MRLLIITQKVDNNDPVLGFFHRWIEEFSKHCEQITVICLYEGVHNLPDNVRVFSLGKEHGVSRLRYILNFYHTVWCERKNYDVVFVHMNPIYVIFGGLLWRGMGKKIGLWYTHRKVDLKLRIAEKLTHFIFTVAKESFILPTKKLNIVGHGIPFNLFKKRDSLIKNDELRIISVGRITPIKNLDTLIGVASILRGKRFNFKVLIVGGPTDKKDEEYLESLKSMVIEKKLGDIVTFSGSVPNNIIGEYYLKSDVSINLCPTGGVDKAVLESIASGILVIASNKAFTEFFGEYSDILLFKERDIEDLSSKIMELISRDDKDKIEKYVYERSIDRASLSHLVPRILKIYETN